MVLFQCTHTTIHQNLQGVHVHYARKGVDVSATHSSRVRAAIAMAKGGPCDCAVAWGRLRLLRGA